MPTHDELERFLREYDALDATEQDRFLKAMKKMVNDLRAGHGYRAGLRVKGVQGHPGIYEMTWAPDGRATFNYGPEQIAGEIHVRWRRVGGHEILNNP